MLPNGVSRTNVTDKSGSGGAIARPRGVLHEICDRISLDSEGKSECHTSSFRSYADAIRLSFELTPPFAQRRGIKLPPDDHGRSNARFKSYNTIT